MIYFLLYIVLLTAIILGFRFSIGLIIDAFPSMSYLFQNNGTAISLFIFSFIMRFPLFFMVPIAIIAGIFFAKVWYSVLFQYLALEGIWFVFSALITIFFGSTVFSLFKISDFIKEKITINTGAMKENILFFFSSNGRLNRTQYFFMMFSLNIVSGAYSKILERSNGEHLFLLLVLLFLPLAYYQFNIMSKRLHDMNSRSIFALIIIIIDIIRNLAQGNFYNELSIVYFVAMLALLFTPGQNEPNIYGDVPTTSFLSKELTFTGVLLTTAFIVLSFLFITN